MRDKIYGILKITNECKSCRECPLYKICDDKEIDICTYLEELDSKLIEG